MYKLRGFLYNMFLQIATDTVTPYDLQLMVVTFKAIGKLSLIDGIV